MSDNKIDTKVSIPEDSGKVNPQSEAGKECGPPIDGSFSVPGPPAAGTFTMTITAIDGVVQTPLGGWIRV